MIPWQLLDSAPIPGSGKSLSLYQRGGEFSIRIEGREVMNSAVHESEEALAERALVRIAGRPRPRVLIGGLGMGFTAAAALRTLGAEGRVVVAELVPAVIQWNRGPLGEPAGRPLQDPRVTVREGDVASFLLKERRTYDAILLDVDNGPEDLTRRGNHWLYTESGLEAAAEALRTEGVLAVWSAGPDRAFSRRLRRAGFEVEEMRVGSKGPRGRSRHTIWLAGRGPCTAGKPFPREPGGPTRSGGPH
jgi:spermidine synthase